MIQIIKRVAIIASVPDKWAERYNPYRGHGAEEKHEITAALFHLREMGILTAKNINDTIGDTSWTENRCTECGKDCERLVRIGDEPDYDVQWVDLCGDCLADAARVLETGDE